MDSEYLENHPCVKTNVKMCVLPAGKKSSTIVYILRIPLRGWLAFGYILSPLRGWPLADIATLRIGAQHRLRVADLLVTY